MPISSPQSAVTVDDIAVVSPALARFTEGSIDDDLWLRPELSARDRSVVTVAVLIARNQVIGMPRYFNKALDSGVTAAELSEIITHLAFYSGWPNAISAVSILKDIFFQRGISPDQIPHATPTTSFRLCRWLSRYSKSGRGSAKT
jgi:4-carboxymuconolactone decarboxylase